MGQKIKSIQEYIGNSFGQWTLLEDHGIVEKRRMVKVGCVCGYERIINFQEIKRGKSTNCGCINRCEADDFIGKKINKLTILEKLNVIKGKTRVKVKCECGKELICRFDSIMNESSKSCGCLTKEAVTTHGLSKHPLFKIWNSMKQRCSNPNVKGYPDYGGRGVKVSMRWENDFEAFFEWAIKRWKPGLQLDKDIKSSTGNGRLYCPELCCFVTRKQNLRATRRNLKITYGGVTMCAIEWAEKLNVNVRLITSRIRNGWTIEDALTKPLDKRYSKIYRNDYKQ